ncbi:MAG TPA: hypothetical protein VGM62_01835 [Chthoniobacterales bacterium]|jgi:hypothetical protein
MSIPSLDPGDLLDLKLMPAWVKEPSTREDYAQYEGEETSARTERSSTNRRDRHPSARKGGKSSRPSGKRGEPGRDHRHEPKRAKNFRRHDETPPKPEVPLDVTVQFLPRPAVLDNVVAQVKAETLAYSLFFLARSFLEKPQRYEVSLQGKSEAPLYQLGETGPLSVDRAFLEANAFRFGRDNFYKVEVTQSEPVKGNFASVARCRLSGTVLGPTNHHDYQRKLRGHYEQRFSRRMSFAEYQRQIENVSDPAAVEQWKEEARNLTTFVTLREEPPVTFPNAAEAERHFRQQYLPNLIRSVEQVTIDGIASRQLGDRRLSRHIEQAWSIENRSPSHLMQDLAKRFRDAGLHIFRHKRGMLFVSSIRVRPFVYDEQSISPHVKAVLELVGSSPRIRRKEVADKLLAEAGEELESRKLTLASDLRWLISEGYLIEFNDGALDLPRVKTKEAVNSAETPAVDDSNQQSSADLESKAVPTSESNDHLAADGDLPRDQPTQDGLEATAS